MAMVNVVDHLRLRLKILLCQPAKLAHVYPQIDQDHPPCQIKIITIEELIEDYPTHMISDKIGSISYHKLVECIGIACRSTGEHYRLSEQS